MTTERPFVTIGIPTYNRSGTLGRANGIGLPPGITTGRGDAISDNASTDDTAAICRALPVTATVASDTSRSTVNVGATPTP